LIIAVSVLAVTIIARFLSRESKPS
jgi:hypothetical protein